jgi:hypothetical protein
MEWQAKILKMMVDDVAIIEMVEKPYIITRAKNSIQTLNTIM